MTDVDRLRNVDYVRIEAKVNGILTSTDDEKKMFYELRALYDERLSALREQSNTDQQLHEAIHDRDLWRKARRGRAVLRRTHDMAHSGRAVTTRGCP